MRGVPSTLLMDGVREQVMGEFRHKASRLSCAADSTIFPWENAAESTIRELKKGSGRKMIKSNSQKKQWDDCLELEMEIRSCTTSNAFELKGDLPRKVMKVKQPTQHTCVSFVCMTAYTSETMLLHTPMTNGFREDGLALALILEQHCVQRS